jgi:hypothetical protein
VQHGNTITLLNVHYTPQFSNLISRQRLPQEGNIHYHEPNARLEINRKIIFKFHDENGKHFVNEDREAYQIDQEWYKRYGHFPLKQFSKIEEVPRGIAGRSISCEAYEKGKSTKAASPKQKQDTIRTTRVLERIHLDLLGPMKTES